MKTTYKAAASVLLSIGLLTSAHSRDYDNNPPGWKGGPGTNWENPAGPRGGVGASKDKRGTPKDRDNNPPGWRGGPGTNWENPAGPRGGAGASRD